MTTKSEFSGAEAIQYAERHLRKHRVNAATWEIEYIDPITGEEWLLDYPQSELHGGGPPRLRKCGLSAAPGAKQKVE